ncbi:hypothetical protein HanPSC8_Chr14g0595661 [Helianthus annuus]|nr:hypothetical protein HanIR_Chr14g0671511 [Helianthus annuus]KAJ0838508.1 hypothetical protein HanPSC8_Chr14g0595661 [Helianthus annuus]
MSRNRYRILNFMSFRIKFLAGLIRYELLQQSLSMSLRLILVSWQPKWGHIDGWLLSCCCSSASPSSTGGGGK